jgi:hypothetical protein
MTRMKSYVTVFVLLFGSVAFAAPGVAQAQLALPTSGAVLYELTENLSLKALKGGQRKATSQLLGFALAGTPLCPLELARGGSYCGINATGSDNINVQTGLGNFGGTFTIVAQGDNPVDSPELVIGRGHFSGKMDFSPALLQNIPYGTVTGEVALNGSRPVPFTGVFRLPVGAVQSAWYMFSPTDWRPVAENERAVGYPTVRFEISF